MNFKTQKKTRRLERKVARRLQRKTHAVIAKFACIGLLSPLHYFLLVYYHIFKLKRGKSKKKQFISHLKRKESSWRF